MEIREIIKGLQLVEDGRKVAQIDFAESEGVLRITNLVVDREYEGLNLGETLVYEAVDYARDKNLEVKPLTSNVSIILSRIDKVGQNANL